MTTRYDRGRLDRTGDDGVKPGILRQWDLVGPGGLGGLCTSM